MKKYNIQDRTFEFGRRIVRLHMFLVKQGGAGRILSPQLLRAGTSVGANMEEADAVCTIALKEARETLFWLRLFEAEKIVAASRISDLVKECTEIVAIITVIIRNSKSS